MRLFKAAILRVFEDWVRFPVNFAVGRLDAGTERISRKRLQNTVLFDALEGKRTDTERHIGAGKTVFFQNPVDLSAPLHSNGITVNRLYMRIQHFIAFAVHCSAEFLPQLENSFCNDFHTVAGIAAHQHTSIVVHDLLFQLRQDILNHIPIIVRIQHHRNTCIRIDFGEQPPQKSDLVAVHRKIAAHDRMLRTWAAKSDRLFRTVTAIQLFQPWNDRYRRRIQKRKAPACACLDC